MTTQIILAWNLKKGMRVYNAGSDELRTVKWISSETDTFGRRLVWFEDDRTPWKCDSRTKVEVIENAKRSAC